MKYLIESGEGIGQRGREFAEQTNDFNSYVSRVEEYFGKVVTS